MTIFLLSSSAYANPSRVYLTPFGEAQGNPAAFLFVVFVVTVFFEFVILSSFLKKTGKGLVLLAVLFVNFASFPLSFLVADIIGYANQGILALIPLVVESLLYILVFRLFFRRSWIPHAISMARCFELGVLSNLVTFLFGVLFLAFLGPRPFPSIARIKNDMRTMTAGIEAYTQDHGTYPPDVYSLTTPTAYIESIFKDPYTGGKWRGRAYSPLKYLSWGSPEERQSGYIIWAMGPDGKYELNEEIIRDILKNFSQDLENPLELFSPYYYDPTNGLRSQGEITRLGGKWTEIE